MEQERELFEKVRLMIKNEVFDREIFSEWRICYEKQSDDDKKKSIEQMKGILGNKAYIDHFLYFFMLHIMPEKELMRDFFTYINTNNNLTWDNLFYIAQQLGALIFLNKEFDSYDLICSNWKLLKKSYQLCKEKLNMELKRIPLEERNGRLGLVITEQFLADNHGPTKTTLDRAMAIKNELGEVLVINTAEMLSPVGALSWEYGMHPNYLRELNSFNYYDWKGMKIPFVQCDDNMPNLDTMRLLLENIRELRPKIVIAVGGMSLFAGLVNEMIPVLNVSTTASGISTVVTEYQAVTLTDNDTINKNNISNLLSEVGINSDHIINGKFTFALKEQFSTVTRNELGIGENEFVLAIVGYRLDIELDDSFWNMMKEVIHNIDIIRILIIGRYNEEKNKELLQDIYTHITYVGMRQDVLAYLDICDLYVNPMRKGGGTSVVEAMYKGVPPVTLNYGDVAGIVDGRYICSDYSEMIKMIHQYYNDKEFYHSQAIFAKQLAKGYLDTDYIFGNILEEYLHRQECKE